MKFTRIHFQIWKNNPHEIKTWSISIEWVVVVTGANTPGSIISLFPWWSGFWFEDPPTHRPKVPLFYLRMRVEKTLHRNFLSVSVVPLPWPHLSGLNYIWVPLVQPTHLLYSTAFSNTFFFLKKHFLAPLLHRIF